MASSSVSRIVRQRKMAKPTEKSRYIIFGFDLRHPFDSLWRLFSSVRLAIILIGLVVLVSTIGTIVQQAPAEVVSYRPDYLAWVGANVQPQFGSWTGFLDWAGIFIIFRTWYFKLLLIVLATNILVGGMLSRAPAIWHKFRYPQFRRADGFYRNSPVRVGVSVGEDGDSTQASSDILRAVFRRYGYKVRVAEGSTDETTYVFAHKFDWTMLSTFVFHTSLIMVMLSGVLTGWTGFGNNSMAQKVLPGPIFGLLQGIAGFSYTQPLPDGSQGIVYPLGTSHNIIYRAKDFVATFDPVRGMPTDFYTDIQIYQDGVLVKQQRIRVNDPLTYQGVTFHQASFMMYTALVIRDAKGQTIFNGPVPLLDHRTTPADPNTGNILQTNNAESVPLANFGDSMNVLAAFINGDWVVGVKGFDAQQRQIFQSATVFNKTCVAPDGTPVAPGTYGCQMDNGWWLQVNTIKRGTVLLITKDAGSDLIWPMFMLLILSISITFLLPPQRLWARIQGNQVEMAALQDHKLNMQRQLDSFARILGNRPLRVAEQPAEKDATHAQKK